MGKQYLNRIAGSVEQLRGLARRDNKKFRQLIGLSNGLF